MTAPPQVNGHRRTALPILGEWRPADPASAAVAEPAPTATAPLPDPVAEAEAEAIRIKAEADADKQRLANELKRMQLEQKQAEHARKLAEIRTEQEEIERQAAAARKKAEADAEAEAAEQAAQQQAEAVTALEQAAADARWRRYALGFYIVCAIVALPVQIAAFWNPSAPWLVIAPLMLEGGAAVVLKGAAAAVAGRRPHWHYRLIAWLLAFIAAGVNLWHGLNAFDPATAIGTAFASVAGPGVWDLHEHGRIRKRDGVLSRRERKAQRAAARRATVEKARAEAAARAEQAATEQAAAEAAQQLAADREKYFPKVWDHAVKLAAALGETDPNAVWRRAHKDIEGTDPGESVDVIRGRNAADRRLIAARSEAPGSTPSKVSNAQRASQMPPSPKTRRYNPPAKAGRRTKGDTPKYVPAARKQAAITAKNAVSEEQK